MEQVLFQTWKIQLPLWWGTYLGTPCVITLPLSVFFIRLPVSVHVLLGAGLSFWQMYVSLARWA